MWSRCLRNMGIEGGRETNPIFVFLFFLLLGFPRRLPFFRAQQETKSQPKQPILKTKNIRYAFSTLATSHSMRLFRIIHDVSYEICRRCSLLSFFLANPIVINRTRFVKLVPAFVPLRARSFYKPYEVEWWFGKICIFYKN